MTETNTRNEDPPGEAWTLNPKTRISVRREEASLSTPGTRGRVNRRTKRSSDDRHHHRRRSHSVSRSPDAKEEGNRCLYVSNLDAKVKERHLEEKFGEIGETDRIVIVKHPHTKESRCFGFVNFKEADKAKEAFEKLNNYELHGSQIKIEFAKRGEPRRKTPGRYLGSSRDVRPSNGSRYSRSSNRDYDRPVR